MKGLLKFNLCLIFVIASCTAGGGKGGPLSTGMHVFSAGNNVYVFNPPWGIITRVDPESGKVTNLKTGEKPVFATAVPDGRKVLVLNRDSKNVYIIDNESMEITIKSVDRDLNTISVSSDGNYAVAYHSYSSEESDFEGILKLNGFSFIKLNTPDDDSINISIGGGAPQGVRFSPDNKKVLIISRNRCFITDFLSPHNYSSIELWPDPSNIIIPSRIDITPDGRLAFILTQNSNYLYVIDISQARVVDVIEGNNPTYFSLFPDGSMGLMVNSGDNSVTLLRIDYATGRVYPDRIKMDIKVNSAEISQTNDFAQCLVPPCPETYYAILYSTTGAENNVELLLIFNNMYQKTVYGYLPAPVQGAVISPSAPEKILLIHRDVYGGAQPLSIINILDETVNMLYLDASPTSVSLAGAYAFLTLKDSNKLVFYNLKTDESNYLKLSALPAVAGLGGKYLFVLHDQPIGLLTFIDTVDFHVTEIKGIVVYGLLDR